MNEVFRKWRREMGLLQKEAAELIGISQGSYSRFEKYDIAGPNIERKILTYYKQNKIEFGGEDNGNFERV